MINALGIAAVAMLVLAGGAAQAQRRGGEDPNLAHPHEVLTVKRDGYTIAGLVTYLSGKGT